MKISVALAAYKGERFVEAQLESILAQLPADGQVVVSDDLPGGRTQEICEKLALADNRLEYIKGPGKGVTANFENALMHCTGEVIFLADQDDVWCPGKVESCVEAIESGADLVLHDASVTDGELNITEKSFFAVHNSCKGFVKNLVRNSFVGCCMAFTRPVLEASLPFPEKLPMHDWWIALRAMKAGFSVHLLNKPLILWRRHGDNVTGGAKNPLSKQIKWRLQMITLLSKNK